MVRTTNALGVPPSTPAGTTKGGSLREPPFVNADALDSDDLPSGEQAIDDHDECDHQQEVNQPAAHREHEGTEQPQDQQDDGDGEEHEVVPRLDVGCHKNGPVHGNVHTEPGVTGGTTVVDDPFATSTRRAGPATACVWRASRMRAARTSC